MRRGEDSGFGSMTMADESRRTAPTQDETSDADTDDLVERSRQLIERGSKSFAGAAKVFDHKTRSDVYLLYAWCRHCDDMIDGQELGFRAAVDTATPAVKLARLTTLEIETARCLDGRSSEPQFRGLAKVVAANRIESRYPFDLLAGLRMDVEGRSYQTLDDVLDYCYCVAGTVGVMMATIMGVRGLPHLRCACDLGIAFQLTNIARDIIDDHQIGRVYLPGDWLAQQGLTPETLADRASRAKLSLIANQLLDVADSYYRSAAGGLPALPFRSAWAVATARSVYRAIGGEIRRQGPAAWDKRAQVPSWRKLAGAGEGLSAAVQAFAQRRTQQPPDRANLWTPPSLTGTTGSFAPVSWPASWPVSARTAQQEEHP
jgi:15-cis-phytoene synthase